MLAHLPIIIFASLPLTTVADGVPKFDIARECRAEGGSQASLEKCVADESNARDQLQPQGEFNLVRATKPFASEKTVWTAPPSYVGIRTRRVR